MALVNQRYRLSHRLGQGGGGSVYLAEDLLHDGMLVALKIVPAGRLASTVMREVRHEFFALSALDHPNLVEALDFGTIVVTDDPHRPGDHYLTYEYIEGENLLAATVNAGWDALIELAYQVLQSLSYIHRHSLIHFDVKPENILVVPGSIGGEDVRLAKLIDFGFSAKPVGPDARAIRGTLAYLAPELLAGGHADHRIDLYSLGITLYQLITGELPPDAGPTIESLKRRLSDPAKRPSRVRTEVPAALDDLVSALTEPDPVRRIGTAAEAATLLESALKRRYVFLPYYHTIRPSQFVGRTEEMNFLRQNLAQAVPASSVATMQSFVTPILVAGPLGIGKTKLMQEVRRTAKANDIPFYDTRCAGRDDRAFAPIIPIVKDIRYRLELRGGPAPALREANAILRMLSEGANDLLDSDPSSLRYRIIERIAQFLGESAARQPFAIWFDDADQADEATADLVAHLSVNAAQHRYLLYIAVGAIEPDAARLVRTDVRSQTIALKEFTRPEAATFAQYMTGDPAIGEKDIAHIAEQVGTSPGMLGHVLSLALRQHDHSSASGFRTVLRTITPKVDLQEQYAQRFETLGRDEQDCLRLLSCFPVPVETSLIEKLLAFMKTRTRQALSRLTNEGITATSEFGTVQIAHAQFRQFVYDGLGGMRVALHRHIADAMERIYAERLEEHAEALAHHHHRSGNLPRAFHHYRQAARNEQAVSAYRRSAEFLEQALTLAPSEAERDEVRDRLAEIYRALSEYAKAEAIVLELLAKADTRERRFTLHRTLGSVQNMLGHVEAAEQSLTDASLLAVSPEERDGIQLDLASVEISKGDYPAARKRLLALQERELEIFDPQLRGDLFNRLGIVEFYDSRLESARRCFSRAVEEMGDKANPEKLISPLLNLGNVHSFQGDFGRAESCWKQALTLTKKACNISLEARIYNNLGIAEFSREHFAQAAEYYSRAIKTFTLLGNRPGQALCLTNIGEVHFAFGAYEEALDVWRSNLVLYESLEDNQGIAEVSVHLAHALVMLGDLAGAEQRLATATTLIHSASLTSQQGIRDLLKSIIELERGEIDHAATSIRAAEEFFSAGQDWRNLCTSRLTRGRIALLSGDRAHAADAYRKALQVAQDRSFTYLRAEALLGLAVTSGLDRAEGLAHPFSYLKEAFDLLENAPLVETTWRVGLALGDAYRRRGLRAKAEGYLRIAVDTIAHLASRFRSDSLRTRFLDTHGRREPERALAMLSDRSTS